MKSEEQIRKRIGGLERFYDYLSDEKYRDRVRKEIKQLRWVLDE